MQASSAVTALSKFAHPLSFEVEEGFAVYIDRSTKALFVASAVEEVLGRSFEVIAAGHGSGGDDGRGGGDGDGEDEGDDEGTYESTLEDGDEELSIAGDSDNISKL